MSYAKCIAEVHFFRLEHFRISRSYSIVDDMVFCMFPFGANPMPFLRANPGRLRMVQLQRQQKDKLIGTNSFQSRPKSIYMLAQSQRTTAQGRHPFLHIHYPYFFFLRYEIFRPSAKEKKITRSMVYTKYNPDALKPPVLLPLPMISIATMHDLLKKGKVHLLPLPIHFVHLIICIKFRPDSDYFSWSNLFLGALGPIYP